MIPVTLILLVIILTWFYGFFRSNDLRIPVSATRGYKKVLVVFPHPDDETLSCGGIIRSLTDHGSFVSLIVLTMGEKGNDDAHLDTGLKAIRQDELKRASSILGIRDVTLEDFGDGELSKQKDTLKRYIDKTIENSKPDLIITYDRSGLYGHDDHIITSEIITDLVMTKYKHISLWYPSLPEKILSSLVLPVHMAKSPDFARMRVTPTHRVLIGKNITLRIRALYAYRSQLYSFKKSFPVPQIPLWFYYSMQIFEYYHKAN